jgi:hypothetical protein
MNDDSFFGTGMNRVYAWEFYQHDAMYIKWELESYIAELPLLILQGME